MPVLTNADRKRVRGDDAAALDLAVTRIAENLRWLWDETPPQPARDQFQIFYRVGSAPQQYVPDFVAETEIELLMVETKARNEMATPEVAAKRQAAEEWCVHASAHAATYGGKPWRYALCRMTWWRRT